MGIPRVSTMIEVEGNKRMHIGMNGSMVCAPKQYSASNCRGTKTEALACCSTPILLFCFLAAYFSSLLPFRYRKKRICAMVAGHRLFLLLCVLGCDIALTNCIALFFRGDQLRQPGVYC